MINITGTTKWSNMFATRKMRPGGNFLAMLRRSGAPAKQQRQARSQQDGAQ